MFYDNLNNVCKKQGTSVTAVIKEIGLNPTSGTYWKKGSFPSGDILIKLSERLNVSTDYLLTGKEKNTSLNISNDKQRLLEMYDLLTDMEKGEILGELKVLTRDIPMAAAARSIDNSIPTKPNIDNLDDFPTMDEE